MKIVLKTLAVAVPLFFLGRPAAAEGIDYAELFDRAREKSRIPFQTLLTPRTPAPRIPLVAPIVEEEEVRPVSRTTIHLFADAPRHGFPTVKSAIHSLEKRYRFRALGASRRREDLENAVPLTPAGKILIEIEAKLTRPVFLKIAEDSRIRAIWRNDALERPDADEKERLFALAALGQKRLASLQSVIRFGVGRGTVIQKGNFQILPMREALWVYYDAKVARAFAIDEIARVLPEGKYDAKIFRALKAVKETPGYECFIPESCKGL